MGKSLTALDCELKKKKKLVYLWFLLKAKEKIPINFLWIVRRIINGAIIYLNLLFSLNLPSNFTPVCPGCFAGVLQFCGRFKMTQLSIRKSSDRYSFTIWLLTLQRKGAIRTVYESLAYHLYSAHIN